MKEENSIKAPLQNPIVDVYGRIHLPGATYDSSCWDFMAGKPVNFDEICHTNLLWAIEARVTIARLACNMMEILCAELDRVSGFLPGESPFSADFCVGDYDCLQISLHEPGNAMPSRSCYVHYPALVITELEKLPTQTGIEAAWDAL